MEAKLEDGYSMRERLLVANEKQNDNDGSRIEENNNEMEEDDGVIHQHGESIISGPTSFSRTCFNGLNALSGVGILSVPYALASGGWLSLIFLFTIAISTYYTALLIQRCMDIDPTIKTYPDIGERAFGKRGRMLVSTTMNVELYMVVTGFLILEGDNLRNLFGDIQVQIFGFGNLGGNQSFVIIISLIILPTVWLNNMSILSYISASGVVASIVLLGSILWAALFDGLGFQPNETKLLNWKGMPTAISLYAFCYCAHPVFPTLYTSMINPKKFSKVMLVCFLLCTISYASMAIVGYLMFGPNVLSQITLNLPTSKISSKIAIYTTLVNPIAKYGLMIKPLVNSFENQIPINYNNKRIFSLIIRTILVLSTIIVAIGIPFFGYLMSFVGAFLSTTASIILPCLCFLKISGIYQRFGLEFVVIMGIVIMGIIIMVVGTYTSVLEIIGHLVN